MLLLNVKIFQNGFRIRVKQNNKVVMRGDYYDRKHPRAALKTSYLSASDLPPLFLRAMKYGQNIMTADRQDPTGEPAFYGQNLFMAERCARTHLCLL